MNIQEAQKIVTEAIKSRPELEILSKAFDFNPAAYLETNSRTSVPMTVMHVLRGKNHAESAANLIAFAKTLG